MFDVRLLMFEGTLPRSACAPGRSTIKHQTSNIHPTSVRPGMSLIELLVVIVILTTLVAGVIPILSPNNDARKIRTAARGLQSYFMLAQAQAASTGRPHGIAFRESSAGSGVALEVFSLEVPVPFAGFSEYSRVEITSTNSFYGPGGNEGVRFSQYNKDTLYDLRFVLASPVVDDLFPPRMFQIGDKINVGGNVFLIVDDDEPATQPNKVSTFGNSNVEYLVPDDAIPPRPTSCVWVNGNQGHTLPLGAVRALKPYQIIRQPVNSAEAPYQIPSGIAVDLQASGVDGSTSGFPISGSFDTRNHNKFNSNEPITDTVGIMFSPNGSISSVIHNGNTVPGVSRIAILLGRVENGNLQYTPSGAADFDKVTEGAWQPDGASADAIDEKQQQVNWLNLDSRWLMISVRDGRMVVSENAFVNPNDYSGTPVQQAGGQINAALEFAREMK